MLIGRVVVLRRIMERFKPHLLEPFSLLSPSFSFPRCLPCKWLLALLVSFRWHYGPSNFNLRSFRFSHAQRRSLCWDDPLFAAWKNRANQKTWRSAGLRSGFGVWLLRAFGSTVFPYLFAAVSLALWPSSVALWSCFCTPLVFRHPSQTSL